MHLYVENYHFLFWNRVSLKILFKILFTFHEKKKGSKNLLTESVTPFERRPHQSQKYLMLFTDVESAFWLVRSSDAAIAVKSAKTMFALFLFACLAEMITITYFCIFKMEICRGLRFVHDADALYSTSTKRLKLKRRNFFCIYRIWTGKDWHIFCIIDVTSRGSRKCMLMACLIWLNDKEFRRTIDNVKCCVCLHVHLLLALFWENYFLKNQW